MFVDDCGGPVAKHDLANALLITKESLNLSQPCKSSDTSQCLVLINCPTIRLSGARHGRTAVEKAQLNSFRCLSAFGDVPLCTHYGSVDVS